MMEKLFCVRDPISYYRNCGSWLLAHRLDSGGNYSRFSRNFHTFFQVWITFSMRVVFIICQWIIYINCFYSIILRENQYCERKHAHKIIKSSTLTLSDQGGDIKCHDFRRLVITPRRFHLTHFDLSWSRIFSEDGGRRPSKHVRLCVNKYLTNFTIKVELSWTLKTKILRKL